MSTPSLARTIETGISTAYPSHWCQDAQGNLIRVNGIQRGSFWRGTDLGTVYQLGITAPTTAPVAAAESGGNASTGNYWCGYRYVDAAGTPSSLSGTICVTAASGQKFNWTSITKPTETRPTKIQLFRTVADEAGTFYRIATLTISDFPLAVTYSTDTAADGTLLASAAADILPLLNDDGSLCARRFEPPPTDMAVVVPFQNRHWYAVGLSIPGATMASVTGWEVLVVGRYLYKEGNARPLLISSAASPNVTLEDGSSQTLDAVGVWIDPGPNESNCLFWSEENEPESVPPAQNVLYFNQNTDDVDRFRAVIPWGMALWICRDRHTLRFSYASDPRYDSSWRLAYARGCLNQRCCGFLDGVAYLIDQMGFWAMSEGPEPIDANIHDYIREGTIDYSKAAAFFVAVENRERVVRFNVIYTTDADTRPKRALCYHVDDKSWHEETYPEELGGAAKLELGSQIRTVAGGDHGRLLLVGEGYHDQDDAGIAWQYKSGLMAMPEEGGDAQLELVYPPTTNSQSCNMQLYYDHSASAEAFKVPHVEGGSSVAAGSANIVVQMRAARSVLGTAPGFERWPLSVGLTKRAIGSHFLCVGLSGTQQTEAIRLSSIAIKGK